MQFPADPEVWVSAETIYQSLYVTSRGALRRELTKCLRTGRALRHPGRKASAKNGARDMINIAERPQEADDRAVPGHWEGDLMIGKANKTGIGTLVERSTGIDIYFCDPNSPWQRGTNETPTDSSANIPKGTDLGKVTALELDQVADELNDRPRKRLGFYNPNERLAELLLH